MRYALTRDVSPRIAECEVTHIAREPIDLARARAQHDAYRRALADLGCRVVALPPAPEHPDGVFVEDTALVLDEVAVLMRPGAPSRRGETTTVEAALAHHRPLSRIDPPATLDGGDILVVGRRVYVGLSSRSTEEAVTQLAALLTPFDYDVRPIEVRDCLHLKSAVTEVADGLLLLDPACVDPAALADHDHVTVDPSEPHAANTLRIGATVLVSASHPKTRARLEAAGLPCRPLDTTELAKAEGGLTCCSLLFEGT